eukprot:scaffold922_cov327-Pinguiococcus_pyrenoidosus.AAC.37
MQTACGLARSRTRRVRGRIARLAAELCRSASSIPPGNAEPQSEGVEDVRNRAEGGAAEQRQRTASKRAGRRTAELNSGGAEMQSRPIGTPAEKMEILKKQIEIATATFKRDKLYDAIDLAKYVCSEYVKQRLPLTSWTLTEDHYYALLSACTHSSYTQAKVKTALDQCITIMEIMELAQVPVTIEMHEDVLRFAASLKLTGYYHLEQQVNLLMDPKVTRDNPPGTNAGYGDHPESMHWRYRSDERPPYVWSEELVNLLLLNACHAKSKYIVRMRLFLDVCMANGYKLWEETLEGVITAITHMNWVDGATVNNSPVAVRLLHHGQLWGYALRQALVDRVVDSCIYEENNFHLHSLIRWAYAQGFRVERGCVSAALHIASANADMRLAVSVWRLLDRMQCVRTAADYEAMFALFVRRGDVLHALVTMTRMHDAGFHLDRSMWVDLAQKLGRSVPRIDYAYYMLSHLRDRGMKVPLVALNAVMEASALCGYEDGVYSTLAALVDEFGLQPDLKTYNAILMTFLTKPDDGWELSSPVLEEILEKRLGADADTLDLILSILSQQQTNKFHMPRWLHEGREGDAVQLRSRCEIAKAVLSYFRETLGVTPDGKTLRKLAITGAKEEEGVDYALISYARRLMLEVGYGEPQFFRRRLSEILKAREADIARLDLLD